LSLFHFSQSLWRRLQGEGLAEEYRRENSEQMGSDFHSLIAIAFSPKEDLAKAFELLAESSHGSLGAVFDHVEDTYLQGRIWGRESTGTVPMFPPKMWNCCERAAEGLPRTTNTCEAWHRRLNAIIAVPYPSLFVFLDQLKEEAAEIDVDRTQDVRGRYPPRKKGQDRHNGKQHP